jgi:ribosomal protein L11 methylase PrmA
MSSDRVPASFRDPSGFLFHHDGAVLRQVNPVFREHYDLMMESGFYQAVTESGRMVTHEELSTAAVPEAHGGAYKILRPEQIPFISYPYEWSFSQLKDAALLTLDLQKRALEFGLWLKDASAYNVQFFRGRPIFIDTLSFEAYPEGHPWVAYRQFCQHFLAPLTLMSYRHVDLGKLLRVYTDGVPLELASPLLPVKTRFRLSLLTHLHAHARLLQRHADKPESAAKATARGVSRRALQGLVDNLESTVRRLEWKPHGTEWGDYYDATNYSEAAQEHKKTLIADFLGRVQPERVWDLGANTGLFSRVAAERGLLTVAFDVDPAAVERNYLAARERQETHLLPLVMDLMNPSTDLGWDNDERMSLRARGPVDLAMALALVHHLAIRNNVPLDRISASLRRLCRWLVIEFVPKSDSQVQRMLATREDIFPGYTQEGFEKAFLGPFELLKRVPIAESERTLYLLEAK